MWPIFLMEAGAFLEELKNESILVSDNMNNKIYNTILASYISSNTYNKLNYVNSPLSHYVTICKDHQSLVGIQYFSFGEQTKKGELFSIYVDPSYRRKGIAKDLIERALYVMLEHQIEEVSIPLSSSGEQGAPNYYLKDYFNNLKDTYKEKIKLQVICSGN